MLIIAWHILTTGEPYQDLGADWFDKLRDPKRETDHLVKRLQALGYTVQLNHAA